MSDPKSKLQLVSYTRGTPYMKDDRFKTLLGAALKGGAGTKDYFAEKQKLVELWQKWLDSGFWGMPGAGSPIIAGHLHGDPGQPANLIDNTSARLELAWFKNYAPAKGTLPTLPAALGNTRFAATGAASPVPDADYSVVGMPAVKLSTDNGMKRFSGWLPLAVDSAGDMAMGYVLWGSLAGPLLKNLTRQVAATAERWFEKLPPDGAGPEGSALTDAVDGAAEDVIGEEGAVADAEVAAASEGGAALTTGTEAAEAVAFETVSMTGGLLALAGLAFFTYLPIYLKGKKRFLALQFEVVNDLGADVSWTPQYVTGDAKQVPQNDDGTNVIPGAQALSMVGDDEFSSDQPLAHAGEFVFTSDGGNSPVQVVLHLDVQGPDGTVAQPLAAVFDIPHKGDAKLWVGQRDGRTDEQLLGQAMGTGQYSTTVNGVQLSIAIDSREGTPDDKNEQLIHYKAVVALQR